MRYINYFYNQLNKLFSYLPSDDKFIKAMRIPTLIFVIVITTFCLFQWVTLVIAMKDKNNFKHEKTHTYNSIHGLKEFK